MSKVRDELLQEAYDFLQDSPNAQHRELAERIKKKLDHVQKLRDASNGYSKYRKSV